MRLALSLRRARRPLSAAMLGALCAVAAAAQDYPGTSDSNVVSRYQGSRLLNQKLDGFTRVQWPSAYPATHDSHPVMTLEGRRERRVYLAPAGRSGIEVQRNYEQALAGAGGVKVLSCENVAPCDDTVYVLLHAYITEVGTGDDMTGLAHDALLGRKKYHAIYKLQNADATRYVQVTTADGFESNVATVIDIVTSQAMDGGKVGVANASAIDQGLKAEGKIALYGLEFDTGRATITPASAPQLAEMAKLLVAQPALKVLIVGHTDNQGAYDANVALSQRRADAVVAALSHDYGVAPARLRAAGDANTAPVATNATDEGRARNRRVEMVVQ